MKQMERLMAIEIVEAAKAEILADARDDLIAVVKAMFLNISGWDQEIELLKGQIKSRQELITKETDKIENIRAGNLPAFDSKNS